MKCYELKIVEKRLNQRQRNDLRMIFLEGKRLYNFLLAEKKRRDVRLNCLVPTDYRQVVSLDKDGNEIVCGLDYLPSHYKQTIHMRMISNEKTIASLVKRGYQKHGGLHFISELTCIPLKNVDWKFKSANKVWIMGVKGKVLVRGVRQIPDECEFANANLIHRQDGYYLKVTTYIDKDKVEEPEKNGKEIGLDFGVKTAITTSEGEKLDATVEESDRLRRLQKKLSRQKKGSNNMRRTIGLIQREYQKLSNQKEDKANKIVHKLKAYDRIYMQDENLTGWSQSGFGKKVQHSILGRVKAKVRLLPQTVMLDKWIPTTRLCPKCGTVNQYITLDDRTYACGCGYSEDRDVHAAKNMVEIAKSCFKNNLVPPEQREITLTEFKASVYDSNVAEKPGRGSEKIAP